MQRRKTWAEISAEIDQQYLVPVPDPCKHPDSQRFYRRLKTIDNRVQLRLQCLQCGSVFGQSIALSTVKNLGEVPWVDEELRDKGRNVWRNTYAEKTEAKNRAFWEYYEKYINSEEWHMKRRLVLQRAGNKCEGCGLRQAVHVHHREYRNLGDEFLFELVALCQSCHQRIHPHREIA